MILQALTAYYETLVQSGKLEAPGWAPAKVGVALYLSGDGEVERGGSRRGGGVGGQGGGVRAGEGKGGAGREGRDGGWLWAVGGPGGKSGRGPGGGGHLRAGLRHVHD